MVASEFKRRPARRQMVSWWTLSIVPSSASTFSEQRLEFGCLGSQICICKKFPMRMEGAATCRQGTLER